MERFLLPNGGVYTPGISPIADAIHNTVAQIIPGLFGGPTPWVKIRDELVDSRNPDRGLRTLWGRPKYVISPIDAAHLKGAILAAIVVSQATKLI